MKLHRKIPKTLLKVFPTMAAVVLSAAVLSGCVNDDSLCPEDKPGFNDSDVVWLTLDISNQSGIQKGAKTTRSNDDSFHEEEASTAFENYIDFSDLEIILLDGNGHAVKRLTSEDFIKTSVDKTDNSQYSIVTKINRGYFTLIGAGKDMTLLALANSKGTGEGDMIGNDIWMKTVSDFGLMLKSFSFSPNQEWYPDGNTRRIPMAGLLKTKAPTEAQIEAANTLASAFDITQNQSLEMQRSMVKIRVIDQTPQQVNLEYPTRIKSVALCNGNSRGAIMPRVDQFSQWGNGTCVLEYATQPIPDTQWHASDLSIPLGKMAEKFLLEDDPSPYDQFVCYAAEQSSTGALKPYLHIVTEEKRGDTTYDKAYDVYMTDILGGRFKEMVRNHIYQFEVKASEKSNIEVSYTICPWISMQTDIEFN